MKTSEMNLGELVQTLKDSGYTEKYSWPVDGKIWRMYTKEKEEVLKAAYVSDTYDLLTTETFKKLNSSDEEKSAIEGIIKRYETGMKKIENAGKADALTMGLPTAIVTALFWARFRNPLAAMLGAGFGYAVAASISYVRTEAAKISLNQYLSEHRVKKDDNALEQIRYSSNKCK